MPLTRDPRPIGVFDSGLGGLTTVHELFRLLPEESVVYFGDTARVPYGNKSRATVTRFSHEIAAFLVRQNIKCLVVACNTASAAALHAMRERYERLPVIGVIEPGARAACAASKSGRILVLATESTVRGGAYQQAIARLRPDSSVSALACGLFVALAEEGWTEGPIAAQVAHRYLEPLRANPDERVDTLVLGCTHFPVLKSVIAAAAGPGVQIVDSAATTAATVRTALAQLALLQPVPPAAGAGARMRFLATDGVERFATVGGRFLGTALGSGDVELVDF